MARSRKQKRTVKQLHADLASLGYDGSYGRVAAFARAWRDAYRRPQQMIGRGTFVPLSFAPGKTFQFDWSDALAILGGVLSKLQVDHFKRVQILSFPVRAILLHTQQIHSEA